MSSYKVTEKKRTKILTSNENAFTYIFSEIIQQHKALKKHRIHIDVNMCMYFVYVPMQSTAISN